MTGRFQTVCVSACCFVASLGWALGAANGDESASAVLTATPGTKVVLACETNAIGLDYEPFKTSNGTLTLELSFKQSEANEHSDVPTPKKDIRSPYEGRYVTEGNGRPSGALIKPGSREELGTWTASVEAGTHEASLGVAVSKVCAKGCVLRATPSGNMELWAPKPVMPSTLEKGETLTLAALDVSTLELKASVMRGEQLSILEKGNCEILKP